MLEIKDENGNAVATVTAKKSNETDCAEGVWLTLNAADGTKPTLCLVNRKEGGWYLGVYRDANKPKVGCDLAISFGDKGPEVQVVRGDSPDDVVIVSLFDFLKKNS